MRCVVNGDEMHFGEPLTVAALILHLGVDGGPVAVERNSQIVPRATHGETLLADGDVIEVVHFVGGG